MITYKPDRRYKNKVRIEDDLPEGHPISEEITGNGITKYKPKNLEKKLKPSDRP